MNAREEAVFRTKLGLGCIGCQLAFWLAGGVALLFVVWHFLSKIW